jgi:predicted nucleic acid-binding protein
VPVVLVDASALVALLDRRDAHHEACVEALEEITDPLVTVLPALTQAAHLLTDSPRGVDAIRHG